MSNLHTDENTVQSKSDLEGKQIASLLDTHANRLSMRTLQQLENGRARAVKAHSQRIAGGSVNHDGTMTSIFSWAEHHRLGAMGMLMGAIIIGVLFAKMLDTNENSDAFLLGAELPPEAFVDQGFAPLLNKESDNI